MLHAKIRGPISVAAQISLLSVGASALPMIARAEQPFVWGVAAREADDAESLARVSVSGAQSQGGGGIGILATATGEGVTVAIVDTGIDLDHPEFAGRIADGGTCFGLCNGADGDDDNGHG